jgi:hypothetical protein
MQPYYITEDSTPAKLGSSPGRLLQLDGDDKRNAFLNAPWVKAVIPIRPGREWKALEWLSGQSIEGMDGLGDLYDADLNEKSNILNTLKNYDWTKIDASLTPAANDHFSGGIATYLVKSVISVSPFLVSA